MKYLVGSFHIVCTLAICSLLLQAYEYSFGSGYGLHPGLAGGLVGVIAVIMMWVDDMHQDLIDSDSLTD